MPPQTPYSNDLGNLEPISAMRDAVGRIHALTAAWTPAQFARSYAPGKWDARTLLIHLAQTELALGGRARFAVATPNYVSQGFDQDAWIVKEAGPNGPDARIALDAFVALNAMNRAFFASLSAAERATTFTHPEYGALTVDWVLHQMAGHVIHHLRHFETIAGM
jgi:hypothetical protein